MTLANGITIPASALGTWQTPEKIAARVVKDAVSQNIAILTNDK